MTRPDPFYSARLRIERAKEHAADLNGQLEAFFAKKPYRRVTQPDPDGINEIHKIQIIERFPFRWRILATEILEHLRASLDHATWASAWLASGNPWSIQSAFPFAGDASKLKDSMRRRSKDVPPEIQTLLASFKPYKGGNDLLCALNDLCNSSKHSLITFMAGAAINLTIQGGSSDGMVQWLQPLKWDRGENDIKFARVVRGADFQHNVQLAFYIAIGDIEVMKSHPASAVFDAMTREAERIVMAIETECRRVGYIID